MRRSKTLLLKLSAYWRGEDNYLKQLKRRINTADNSPVEDETPNRQLSENILIKYLLNLREMCAFDRNQSSKINSRQLTYYIFRTKSYTHPKSSRIYIYWSMTWIQLWNSAIIEYLWSDDVLMFQSHLQSVFVNKEVVAKWQWYKLFRYFFLSSLNISVLLTFPHSKDVENIWMHASSSILVSLKERSTVKRGKHACVLKICHVRVTWRAWRSWVWVPLFFPLPTFPFFAC